MSAALCGVSKDMLVASSVIIALLIAPMKCMPLAVSSGIFITKSGRSFLSGFVYASIGGQFRELIGSLVFHTRAVDHVEAKLG